MRGCAVSRRYTYVCNSDVFSVVKMYVVHLKLCVVLINDRRYVCCGECYAVSNECHDATPCLVQSIAAHGGEVMYFWLYSPVEERHIFPKACNVCLQAVFCIFE